MTYEALKLDDSRILDVLFRLCKSMRYYSCDYTPCEGKVRIRRIYDMHQVEDSADYHVMAFIFDSQGQMVYT
jgi:hypothetical protein